MMRGPELNAEQVSALRDWYEHYLRAAVRELAAAHDRALTVAEVEAVAVALADFARREIVPELLRASATEIENLDSRSPVD